MVDHYLNILFPLFDFLKMKITPKITIKIPNELNIKVDVESLLPISITSMLSNNGSSDKHIFPLKEPERPVAEIYEQSYE